MSQPTFRIETLKASYEAFGMVLDLLSKQPPFAEYRLNRIANAVGHQLTKGYQVAALTPGNELIGYAGWVRTSRTSAELWLEDRGSLKLVDDMIHDAIAMTIVLSTDASATIAMIRRARQINPGVRAFFKRGYEGQIRNARKQFVTNR